MMGRSSLFLCCLSANGGFSYTSDRKVEMAGGRPGNGIRAML